MKLEMLSIFFIFMTGLFSAMILVPLLRHWGLSTGTVDQPDARKVHKTPIPRLGGIAIFMGFLFSAQVFIPGSREVRGLLAGALVMFLTGLIDDLYGLPPRRKFLGEIGACLVAILVSRIYIHHLGNLFGFGVVRLDPWVGIPFTVFALVGVINALNLIDGLDGLAGGVSVIALFSFGTLGLLSHNSAVAALCAALLGSVLGFLKYNFYPARIFMGDSGSLVVGFVLGALAVFLTQMPGATVPPVIPVIILGLPILDTIWVMTRRSLHGQSPFAPDKTHLHHKFLNLGFQHRFTVLLIYGLSLFWAIFSVFFYHLPEVALLLTYLLVSVVLYALVRYVLNHRERFAFLSRDSATGLRYSVLYQRIARGAEKAMPVLLSLVLLYLVLAAWYGVRMDGHVWQVTGLLFLGGVGILYLTRDTRNHFLLALLYVAGLVIIFNAEQVGHGAMLLGLSLHRFNNVLFAVIASLAAFKIAFRQDGEFFIATVDVLLLGMSIFLAVVFSEVHMLQIFSGALVRGVILFVAIKAVSAQNRTYATYVAYSLLGVALAATLAGMLA